jgi:membrane protease YdiL (CAAX protease family)
MFEPSEFFHFLQRPQYPFLKRKKTHILRTSLKIYFITLLFVGLVNLLILIILKAFLTLPIDRTLEIPVKLREHLWNYFFLVVFLAPVIEEIIFRLSLVFNPFNISLSLATLFGLLVNKVSDVIIAITVFFILLFILYRLAIIYRTSLISFWNKKFIYIFYCLPIIFGLVHLNNYMFVDLSQYLIAPLLILPQLALGFILSFTRLYFEKGFLICILIHVLMNMISVFIYLLQYIA